MPFTEHDGVVIGIGSVLTGDQVGKQQYHIVVELALIGFQRQQVVGVLFDDGAGDRCLAADGVNGHQTAPQIERLQQLRIAVISFDLAATLRCPNTSHSAVAQALTM